MARSAPSKIPTGEPLSLWEDKGINCYALNGTVVADETMDSIYQDIENMGKIFKVEDKAEALIEDTKAQISEIQDAVKDVKEEDKVKAFVMDSLSGNEIYTTSAGLESNLIELAGGINTTKGMSDSRWFTTSVETLVTANPDVIIFNDYGVEGQVQENMDFITNNAALADVPAVKNPELCGCSAGICYARPERSCCLPGFRRSFLSGLLH